MTALLAFALLQAPETAPNSVTPLVETTARVEALGLLRDEDLVLFAVDLERLTLTDSLTTYGDPIDPLLPVGELARLLDLDLNVSPSERRITGTLGEARRSVTIDFNAPVARLAGNDIPLTAGDIGYSRTDLFIRASALERVLPVKFEIDAEALSIRINALEKLPIQARMERLGRAAGAGTNGDDKDPALLVEAPYLLFSPPSFDVALETGIDSRNPRFPRRYDIRVAGDLLYTSFQGYLGSDETGTPSTARILFERRSAGGNLLGPLGATRVSAGDVFTPSLAIGPRSGSGRGFSFTTAALEEVSVFNTIDLRGELPIGFDAELYINDVLRSGQRTPVQGRYEFLAVPLVRGINVIRIVLYGARGERSEIVRVVNVGGGQIRKKQLAIEFGIVEQDKAVLDPRPLADREPVAVDVGAMRLVANAAYGLTDGITLVGGLGIYTSIREDSRNVLMAGIRTSLLGLAVQVDGAGDHKGGAALALGLAGQPLGVSTLFRHAEYRGGFIDEAASIGDFLRPPSRKTSLTLDLSLPPIAGKVIPLSFRILRDGYPDGGSGWTASARTSTTIAGALISTGFDYQRDSRPETELQERLSGSISASKFIDFKWQLRGTFDFELLPKAKPLALSFSADRAISDDLAVRFGIGQTLVKPRDTFFQTGATLRLPFGDLALTGDYAVRSKDWRFGVRFAFGSLFDRGRGRYVVTPPGPASGGNAIIHSFIDNDANGRFGPGDVPAERVTVEGGERQVVTSKSGRAVVTGLGTAPTNRIKVNIQDIDSLYVGSPPANLEFAPRPGRVLEIPYPLTPAGEVYAKLVLRQAGAAEVGISAVRLKLVREGADPIVAITEYDGSVVFGEVPLGTYRLEIEAAQAERLKMRLKEPIKVVVTSDGATDIEAEVIFEAPSN